MRRTILTVAALMLAATAHAQAVATPCTSAPTPEVFALSTTRQRIEREYAITSANACLGLAEYVRASTGTVRYRVKWPACVDGQPWRVGGDSSSMAKALAAAGKPPACPPPPPPPPPPAPSGSAWLESFTGLPSSPQPFAAAGWDVQRYSRNEETWVTPTPMQAQHGVDCGGPPLVHDVTTYEQQVFLCRDHVMTALNETGYGAIVLTPNRMLDWSGGEQVLRFNVNTASNSVRDWWKVWLTPYADVLPLPTFDWAPGLNGYPRTSLIIEQSEGGVCPALVVNYVEQKLACDNWRKLAERMAVSFSVRSTVEVRVSRTHVKVWMPTEGIVFADVDAAIPFAQGVVQIGHYSYNPAKDCPAGQTCGPNTWHWDEVSLSNAVPFTIIGSDVRALTDSGRVTFAAPAPDGATLRLTAGGYHPLLSFDNGATWAEPALAPYIKASDAEAQYVTPIPAGVTSMLVKRGAKMVDWWPRGWVARDFTVWAR